MKLKFERIYTTEGIHPYDEVKWESRDVVLTNWRDGSINFEQKGVEFPDFWEQNAVQIVVSKWFRGALGTPKRETSLKDIINRIVKAYTSAGTTNGYFDDDNQQTIFAHEMTYMLLHQIFTFNSPVWFNVGTKAPQQVSACFLLAVEDSMNDILDWYKEEGLIFKGGSGAGVNLSKIRSSKELLSSGGNASGPVSFMRGADSNAGTIKSGGATRRAAKMVILDIDHPDIEEFIDTKMNEEEKIRVLRNAGYDMDLGGKDIYSVQYQNANNSVRVSDDFMRAVVEDRTWPLKARSDGSVLEEVPAKHLWDKMCKAAWACADPGIQYDDTINNWHTCPKSGRITTSNPCAEYLHLDNSSCNLASINLLKFLSDDLNGAFEIEKFIKVCELVITAMDISICFADFPTEKIAKTTRDYRQLGMGYTNLGALLMAMGLPYDSENGRSLAASITSLMSAVAYRRSAEIAEKLGPYEGYKKNTKEHQQVIIMHRQHAVDKTVIFDTPLWIASIEQWDKAISIGQHRGYRNAQATLLAPTGTSGLALGADTTGVEPALGLVTFKKLVGGGSMQFVNQTAERALATLGYDRWEIERISEFIAQNGHVVGAPDLRREHYAVFDCAMGERSIAPMGHVRMMAAIQPFLSGSISKTINLPESATIEDVSEVYMEGWKLGLKCVALYRDNCKVGQPLSVIKKEKEEARKASQKNAPVRKRLPKKRPSETVSFTVAGAKGYMIASEYPEDGQLGEVFLRMSKQGSTLAGVMDAFSIAVSIGLQYGVPLETFVRKFTNMRFDPAGMTDDPDVRIASSVVDYIFRRLALDFMAAEERADMGILTTDERRPKAEPALVELMEQMVAKREAEGKKPRHENSTTELMESKQGYTADAPLCLGCGIKMRRAGSCYVCEGCGSTSGCS